MRIRNKFKIHGLNVAQGERRSAHTPKFYNTYEEAEQAATNIVAADPACTGIVIYAAITVITHDRPPIITLAVD